MDISLIFLIFHIFGVTLGAGGAFTGDYLFFTSLRDDRKIEEKEIRLLQAAGRVVWIGLAVLFVSGIGMLLTGSLSLLSSPVFLVKMTIVGVIVLNGIAFHHFHLPFLKRMFQPSKSALKNTDNGTRINFVFASGAISSVSWIYVIILGYLRILPYGYGTIIATYIIAVAGAFVCALVVKQYIFISTVKTSESISYFRSEWWRIASAIVLVAAFVFSVFAYIGAQQSNTAGSNKVDTSINLIPKSELLLADVNEIHVSYAPHVPSPITRSDQRIIEVYFEAIEGVCEIDSKTGTLFSTWGYRIAGDTHITCGSPGPVIRGRVGDIVRFTLTNHSDNIHSHNIDFHAATGPGGGAAGLTVAPGEIATIEFRLMYPGAFMYHCAFGDVPEHVARGKYGLFIVDPEIPLPLVDHEWAVMQSEWYPGESGEGGIVANTDFVAILDERPKFVTFNGRTDALRGDNALVMRNGERARIYFINHGLSLNSNFHPIGSHWDVVYPEGATHPANFVLHGSQSTLVVTGGGVIVELKAIVPGDILLVDHALGRAFYKGALGIIKVLGEENPEIFEVITTPSSKEEHKHNSDKKTDAASVQEFFVEAGNFYYSLKEIRIKKGDTVRVTLQNTEGLHDFVIDEFNVETPWIQKGESVTIQFMADRVGEFEYYCSIGHHRELGQWGTLIVEEE